MSIIMVYFKHPKFLIARIKCRIFGHDPFKNKDGTIQRRGAFCSRCGEVLSHLEDPNDHGIKICVSSDRVKIENVKE